MKKSDFCTNVREVVTLKEVTSVKGIESAKNVVYKLVQSQFFAAELKALSAGVLVSKSSPIYKLHPFLDKFGVIRVGGRLRSADIGFNSKYPVILPSAKDNAICKVLDIF